MRSLCRSLTHTVATCLCTLISSCVKRSESIHTGISTNETVAPRYVQSRFFLISCVLYSTCFLYSPVTFTHSTVSALSINHLESPGTNQPVASAKLKDASRRVYCKSHASPATNRESFLGDCCLTSSLLPFVHTIGTFSLSR